MKEQYEGRNVIWESKTKSIFSIVVCFIFTALTVWANNKMTSFMFWLSLIIFGLGGIFMLIRLLNPKNIFVTYKSEIGKKILAEREETFINDTGLFQYDENGFSLHIDGLDTYYKWNEIETVFGYKIDLLAYDEICLDIYPSDDKKITITEETLGWFQFISNLSQNIPVISIDWYINISHPAFEKNLTLLYDKKNRTSKELEFLYYTETEN
jgi:hypothetical protein